MQLRIIRIEVLRRNAGTDIVYLTVDAPSPFPLHSNLSPFFQYDSEKLVLRFEAAPGSGEAYALANFSTDVPVVRIEAATGDRVQIRSGSGEK